MVDPLNAEDRGLRECAGMSLDEDERLRSDAEVERVSGRASRTMADEMPRDDV